MASTFKKTASKLLGLFGEVEPREVVGVLLMFSNLFLLLVGYYILKTVREPLILETGGAEQKSYAAAAQAIVLMGFVPLYGWVASRVSRKRLIVSLNLFFIVCLELFYFAALFSVPFLGFVFYVWVGVFSLSAIAQFWSFANERYNDTQGNRLFPIIAVGATLGSPLGSGFAGLLSHWGVEPFLLFHVTAGILALNIVLYIASLKVLDEEAGTTNEKPLAKGGGFKLVLQSSYLRTIALLLILLNLVNTTGEFILAKYVIEAAEAAHLELLEAYWEHSSGALNPALIGKWIGAFYGGFFSVVNVVTVVLQGFIASRLTKKWGLAGLLFVLPVVALGTYGLAAAGVGFALFSWAKTAENSTDYSLMNTAKAMLWLPTTPDEKYKAKQAIDTFFVRFGDVLAAGVVWLGTNVLAFKLPHFAYLNLVLILGWLAIAWVLLKKFNELHDDDGAA